MTLRDAQTADSWRAFGRGFASGARWCWSRPPSSRWSRCFVLQGVLFDGGLTAVDEGRLLRITHDDYVHVSVQVQQLKKHPPTDAHRLPLRRLRHHGVHRQRGLAGRRRSAATPGSRCRS